MSNHGTPFGSASSAPAAGPNPPRRPRTSTFIAGGVTALFMIIGAFSAGLGGALVFLAISAALTSRYVLATGRRANKRAGAARSGAGTRTRAGAARSGAGTHTRTGTGGGSCANCSAVKAAGAAPIYAGQAGYRAGLTAF